MLIVVLGVLLTLQPCIAKTATGTVTCNGKPYPDAKVQKWLPGEVLDDIFTARSHNYVTTDANGKFEFTFGSSRLDMHVYVLHKCNYDGKCALMRTELYYPKELSDSLSLSYELSEKKHTVEYCGEL
ncbi:unnamed protein product [Nippostrongylus brasiliensis]|uniref:Transthyretin-like family protein n=1 Tax=Nippostrongylus brasiliensis TaxID=27835 RepID=A0A0N4YFT2_NIPBR|nr:hypothetical protein Q1695_006906 [Nippostrongylus brasiliensis]VDL79223.1 unnamed protein product [Nippostrongylus brasiliensis]